MKVGVHNRNRTGSCYNSRFFFWGGGGLNVVALDQPKIELFDSS